MFFQLRGGFLNAEEVTTIAASSRTPASEREDTGPASTKLFEGGPSSRSQERQLISSLQQKKVDTSQLHQSRVGLLSQALMLSIIVGFLFSETLSEFWKKKLVNILLKYFVTLIFWCVQLYQFKILLYFLYNKTIKN